MMLGNKGIMKAVWTLTAFSLIAFPMSTRAADIHPGLWKISVESEVPASPDGKPQPFEITQCLTEADARNPEQIILGMGSPGATGCDFLNKQYSGSSLSFDVSCGGSLGIKGHGEVTYTATTLDGFLNVNLGETEKIDMNNRIHAIYLGACPSAGGGPQ